jgi:epoxyqueuosine reductase
VVHPRGLGDDCRAPAGVDEHDLTEAVLKLAIDVGCAAVGLAPAGVFEDTRAVLHERRGRGLHGGMQFTYRNPERSTDPGRIVAGARSLVVAAWDYHRRDDGSDAGGGSVAEGLSARRPVGRVAEYARHDHYADLRAALGQVAGHLRAAGWRAEVVCDDNALVDRAAGHRAGIGWYGKNSLLILPGRGSRFVLGSVVTDARLVSARQSESLAAHGDGCGACRRCQVACPTGALDEPGVLDARRCLAWLLQAPGAFPVEHRRALGDRIYGCDECQNACPINRAADRRPSPLAQAADVTSSVDLLDMLAASDDDLMARFARWYIAGRNPRHLRRNALVVLGNVGDGSDPATAAALRRWISCGDELLAEHARWAARALGRADLCPART